MKGSKSVREQEVIEQMPAMHQKQMMLKKDFLKMKIEVKKRVKIFLKNGISKSNNGGKKK